MTTPTTPTTPVKPAARAVAPVKSKATPNVTIEAPSEAPSETISGVKSRDPGKFRAQIYGVGGVKTIFIKGVDPLVAVKLKIDNLPGGVTIMGVESGEGVINLRWSSSVAVNAVITGTVTL